MKVFELKKGTFLVQNMKNKYYFIYDGCDGMYGKFIEVNHKGEKLNHKGEKIEPKKLESGVSYQERYVFFSCGEDISKFNLEIISTPPFNKQDVKNILKKVTNGFKKTIENLLSSWIK